MMLHATLHLAAVLAGVVDRADAQPPPSPTGPPPVLVIFKVERNDVLTARTVVFISEKRRENRKVFVKRGDKVVPEIREVEVEVIRPYVRAVAARTYQVLGADGKRLGRKVLARFKDWAPAVLSGDGKGIEPYYRQFIKEGLPVLILPQETRDRLLSGRVGPLDQGRPDRRKLD